MPKLNQRGVVHLIPVLVVLGLIGFFAISNFFDFKNSIFSTLFNKIPSFAAGDTIQFVDSSDKPITTTNYATVKVKYTEPSWETLSANLMPNPGCESNITGWQAWHGQATRATNVAHSGIASCQAALNTSDSIYALDDTPRATVSNPQAGVIYTASAWVRSDSAVGKPVGIILRQWKDNNKTILLNAESGRVSLTTSWQKITVSAIISQGVSGIDVYLPQYNAEQGNSFQADDIELVLGGSVPVSTNLIKNAGCDLDFENWGAFNATPSKATVARTGSGSCQTTLNTSNTTYTLDDIGKTVYAPQAGERYTGEVWVRSDSAIGKPVVLVLRQWKDAAIHKNIESPKINLTNSWQRLSASVTIESGVNSLDFYVAQNQAVTGNSFQSDDINLTKTSPLPLTTQSVTFSEDPNFPNDPKLTDTTQYTPTTPYYWTFSDFTTPGKKVLYAKFTSSSGTTKNAVPFPTEIDLQFPQPCDSTITVCFDRDNANVTVEQGHGITTSNTSSYGAWSAPAYKLQGQGSKGFSVGSVGLPAGFALNLGGGAFLNGTTTQYDRIVVNRYGTNLGTYTGVVKLWGADSSGHSVLLPYTLPLTVNYVSQVNPPAIATPSAILSTQYNQDWSHYPSFTFSFNDIDPNYGDTILITTTSDNGTWGFSANFQKYGRNPDFVQSSAIVQTGLNVGTVLTPGHYTGNYVFTDTNYNYEFLRVPYDFTIVDVQPTPTPKPTSTATTFKKIFSTTNTYDGFIGGLSGADLKCQNEASSASLSGVFKAWLSDSNVSASSRLSHSTIPYRLVDGTLIAVDWSGLTSGSIVNPINKTASGSTIPQGLVWTGTDTSGLNSSPYCNDWTTRSTSVMGRSGGSYSTDSFWTSHGSSNCGSIFARLYCLEQ